MTNEVVGRERIPLPAAVCWEKVRDFTRALEYVPNLTDLRITTPATSGVGASRVVVSSQAGSMDETITEWNEGRGFTIRLHRGDKRPLPPIREASVEYALEPAGESATDIVLRMRYELGLGPLGALLNALVVRRVMQRSMSDVAMALADNYVRDARVTPERLAELKALKAAG